MFLVWEKMKLFDIRINSMHYGLCVANSIEAVQQHYTKIMKLPVDVYELELGSDMPVMEINVTQEIKDCIK